MSTSTLVKRREYIQEHRIRGWFVIGSRTLAWESFFVLFVFGVGFFLGGGLFIEVDCLVNHGISHREHERYTGCVTGGGSARAPLSLDRE